MNLRVNGKDVELPGPISLLDYIARLGVDPLAVAVELNGEIVARESYTERTLNEGDRLEIVRMVGGGRR
ncbi:MAG: sulfur carrier protein ThiS [Candidatus Dormibacter sp.]|uniref:sulfur carrier protein ThiS n=1 Tax=Candidatus Dormibacter sp. TaxID=2973982 RepID=UPI000DAF7A6C|nr:MAG: thiamine biosynthesis protein ThiS [Candidatus Dormibacteraeota bacterium]